MISSQKVCRKCLIEDMDTDEFFNRLNDYIKNYPEEKRADEVTYKNRLDICKSCRYLINKKNKKCGCYVELRALKKNMYCPHVPQKW